MSHWLDTVVTLLEAETSDLLELCRIAGGNPKTFYRGIDPERLDLAGQSLDEVHLYGLNSHTREGLYKWESPTIIDDLADFSRFEALYIQEAKLIAKETGNEFVPDQNFRKALARVSRDYRDYLGVKRRPHQDATQPVSELYTLLHDQGVTPQFLPVSQAAESADPVSTLLLSISPRALLAYRFCFRFLLMVAWFHFKVSPLPEYARDAEPLIESAVREFEMDVARSFKLMTERAFVREVDAKQLDRAASEKVVDALRRVATAGRQEERIALVLDEFLKDRKTGTALLATYQHDRAQFARTALGYIRANLLRMPVDDTHEQIQVARLIPRLYTDVFPSSRGILLFYLAFHLSKYPPVHAAIKRAAERSNSIYVFRERESIFRAMGLDPPN